MRLLRTILSGFAVVALAPLASAQWYEDFDSYSPGPLTAQSVWEEWVGSSGVDVDVSTANDFTPLHGIYVESDDDVVYDFANLGGGRPTSGRWILSVKTYVSSSSTGDSYVIMLNDYPNTLNWSVQTLLDADDGKVINQGADGGEVTLKYDEWVTLTVCIDLDADRVDQYYGSVPLVLNQSWVDGVSGGGQKEIGVLDLYGGGGAGGTSGMYFDDVRMENAFGGCIVMTSAPNPAKDGDTLTLTSISPHMGNNDLGILFLWTVNDLLFVDVVAFFTTNFAGRYNLSGSVPPGVAGLQAGFKSAGGAPGGGVMLSNEDLIVFE